MTTKMGRESSMKMDGCEQGYRDKLKSPANWSKGTSRMDPKSFARNNLSMGGVNTDLGGGWAPKEKDTDLPAGKASDGNPSTVTSAGRGKR